MPDSFKFTIPTAFNPPPTKREIQERERAARKAQREEDRKAKADLTQVQPNQIGSAVRKSSTSESYDPQASLYMKRGPRTKEQYVGKRYGRVIGQVAVGRNQHNDLIIRCLCDCGQHADILLSRLRKNQVISCGCARDEQYPITTREQRTLMATVIKQTLSTAVESLHLPTAERSEGCEISNQPNIPDPIPIATEYTSLAQQVVSEQLQGYLGPHQELDEDELDYESWLAELKNPSK